MRIALSFDVEDWYMGLELPEGGWEGKERRLEVGLSRILSLLNEKKDRKDRYDQSKNREKTFVVVRKHIEIIQEEIVDREEAAKLRKIIRALKEEVTNLNKEIKGIQGKMKIDIKNAPSKTL